jgi:hypothetical protein
MTQPLGNCPGCGGDEPFGQVHLGPRAGDQCPEPDPGGECPEWVCSGCGAGVFMASVSMSSIAAGAGDGAAVARHSSRAA